MARQLLAAAVAVAIGLTLAGPASAGDKARNYQPLGDITFWDAASVQKTGDLVVYEHLRVIKSFDYGPGGMKVGYLGMMLRYETSCAKRVSTVRVLALYDSKGKLRQMGGGDAEPPQALLATDPMSPVLDRLCAGDLTAPAGETSIKAAIARVASRGS